MNAKELIEKYEYELKLLRLQFGEILRTKVYEELLDYLKQLDEPQKVQVPQFVADLIKYALDGYTVEEEKRYRVKMKKVGYMSFLNHDLQSDSWLINNGDNGEIFKTHHTRKELEDAGFGWVFDCPGVEIDEVEGEI